MKRTSSAPLPRMRTAGLIVDKLPDEVLVYDTERHKAHCLNRTAALVWENCDGRRRPREIAECVEVETSQPFSEEMVWLAVRQLNEKRLLERAAELPAQFSGLTRRQMVRTLGIAAAVSVPLISSIVSPTAVQAATCVPTGGNCTTSAQCCPGNFCDTPGSNKCKKL